MAWVCEIASASQKDMILDAFSASRSSNEVPLGFVSAQTANGSIRLATGESRDCNLGMPSTQPQRFQVADSFPTQQRLSSWLGTAGSRRRRKGSPELEIANF